MLVAVVAEKNYAKAQQKIESAIAYVDAIELRLDYFDVLTLSDISRLKNIFSIPMIFTLRKSTQGGLCQAAEDQRLAMIEKLAQIEPAFIDLEYDTPIEFVLKLKQQHPTIQFICSYHNFQETPENLSQLFLDLQHDVYSIYKIVTFAQSTLDSLKMLLFAKAANAKTQMTGFCMGELGVSSRVLGAIVGNIFHYVTVDDIPIAPGQLCLDEMLNIYYFRSIHSATKIFALLGDPIEQSPGHIVHNKSFQHFDKNAIYVKLNLKSSELKEFFSLVKELPFYGFSVTLPYKQDVISYLDQIDEHAKLMKSVNTVAIEQGKLMGYNTDAKGALDAIGNKINVKNKKMVIIGAGGTARSIGYEALRRGARVIFLNRTAKKAEELAVEMNCLGCGFDQMATVKSSGYDILINTTPVGMSGYSDSIPIPEDFIIPHSIVMDCVYKPVETLLLKAAQALNCTVVYGYEMFINQAVLQFQLWFNHTQNLNDVRTVYEEALSLLNC